MSQLFPGLKGESLIEEIRLAYTPSVLLNDTQAKDTLYARIFRAQDTVYCIYSDLPRYLPDGVDPSQWLFGTGLEVTSLNLEHSWPQAKGAGEGTKGNTDMHHLFPSRTDVNSDRANHPYGDIPDQQTVKWYFRDQEMSSIPNSNMDGYSEYMPLRFEPRESVKGDIARAMMYFWTIYREDAVAADPAFFDLQRSDLCAWHMADPADGLEMDRTMRIAGYQDEKPNPFILDCTLAIRAYCPELSDCGIVAVDAPEDPKVEFEYNSATKQFRVLSGLNAWYVQVIHPEGYVLLQVRASSGEWVGVGSLPTGIYFVTATDGKVFTSWPILVTEP